METSTCSIHGKEFVSGDHEALAMEATASANLGIQIANAIPVMRTPVMCNRWDFDQKALRAPGIYKVNMHCLIPSPNICIKIYYFRGPNLGVILCPLWTHTLYNVGNTLVVPSDTRTISAHLTEDTSIST